MSSRTVKKPSDVIKAKQDYLDNLDLQVQLNKENEDANRIYKATGQLPPSTEMRDGRTTTEILADSEKLKINLIKDLEAVANPQFAQLIVNRLVQSPLNVGGELLVFAAQRAPNIVEQLKKLYKYGIKGDANDAETFVQLIHKFYTDANSNFSSTKQFMSRMGTSKLAGLNGKLEEQHRSISELMTSIIMFRAGFLAHGYHASSADPGRREAGNKHASLIKDIISNIDTLVKILEKLNKLIPQSSQEFEQYESLLIGMEGNPEYERLSADFKVYLYVINEQMPNFEFIGSLLTELKRASFDYGGMDMHNTNDQAVLSSLEKFNDILLRIYSQMDVSPGLLNDALRAQTNILNAINSFPSRFNRPSYNPSVNPENFWSGSGGDGGDAPPPPAPMGGMSRQPLIAIDDDHDRAMDALEARLNAMQPSLSMPQPFPAPLPSSTALVPRMSGQMPQVPQVSARNPYQVPITSSPINYGAPTPSAHELARLEDVNPYGRQPRLPAYRDYPQEEEPWQPYEPRAEASKKGGLEKTRTSQIIARPPAEELRIGKYDKYGKPSRQELSAEQEYLYGTKPHYVADIWKKQGKKKLAIEPEPEEEITRNPLTVSRHPNKPVRKPIRYGERKDLTILDLPEESYTPQPPKTPKPSSRVPPPPPNKPVPRPPPNKPSRVKIEPESEGEEEHKGGEESESDSELMTSKIGQVGGKPIPSDYTSVLKLLKKGKGSTKVSATVSDKAHRMTERQLKELVDDIADKFLDTSFYTESGKDKMKPADRDASDALQHLDTSRLDHDELSQVYMNARAILARYKSKADMEGMGIRDLIHKHISKPIYEKAVHFFKNMYKSTPAREIPTRGVVKSNRIEGYGVRMRGCGLGGMVDTSQGIQPSPSYIRFGKYLINTKKLNNNIVSLRRDKGSTIKAIPARMISPHLGSILKKIVGGGMPTYDDLNKLTDEEKQYLHRVTQESDIFDKLSIPTPSKDKEEQDAHQFNVLKGEIMAGNNSKEVITKFKLLVLKLSKQGILPKNQVQEILEELLELGL